MEAIPASIGSLPLRSFGKSSVLLAEGGAGSEIYFLMSGTVEVRKGAEIITRVRERGAMLGEMAVLLNCPNTATVVAASDVECRVASEPMAFLAAHPDVMLYVCQVLARRLDSLNRYLVDVKHQLRDQEGHVGMVDGVLDALMNRHPRQISPRYDAGE